MGCGGSKKLLIHSEQRRNASTGNRDSIRVTPEGAEQHRNNKDLSTSKGNMEENKDEKFIQDDEEDELLDRESDEPIDVTKPFKKGFTREKINALKVEDFVKEGIKIIKVIKGMSMDLEDMPANFKSAKKLRQLYFNARYAIGRNFCKTFLDDLVKEGVFACIVNAMKRLYAAWPNVFLQTQNLEEV